MASSSQPSNFNPSSDTDKEVPGTQDIPGSGMDDEGKMPIPKRRKRNTGKRDDS